LLRQGGRQTDQQRGITVVTDGDENHGSEDDRQSDDSASRAQALARDDGANLRPNRVAQPRLEAGKPEPKIVAVAAEHVVPGGVTWRHHAALHALAFALQ